jgi:hypothetical protein
VNRFRQGMTEESEKLLGATRVTSAVPERFARALDGADGNGG